jgi:hypothetical protein
MAGLAGSLIGGGVSPVSGGQSGAKSAANMFEQSAFDRFSRFPKAREKIIDMPIKQFLDLAHKDRANSIKKDTVEGVLGSGNKLSSIPILQVSAAKNGESQVWGHEGRHRARALLERGYNTMPVLLESSNIRWSEQGNPSNFDYIKNWPKTLISEDGEKFPFPVSRDEAPVQYFPRSDNSSSLVDKGGMNG